MSINISKSRVLIWDRYLGSVRRRHKTPQNSAIFSGIPRVVEEADAGADSRATGRPGDRTSGRADQQTSRRVAGKQDEQHASKRAKRAWKESVTTTILMRYGRYLKVIDECSKTTIIVFGG